MAQLNIIASVGKGGRNSPEDVRRVQALLNTHLRPPYRPLAENGVCDAATISAIEEFQRRVVNLQSPDGRVDPQGRTMRALSPPTLMKTPDVLVPYRVGRGLYVYSASKNIFGTPKAVASIQALARQVSGQLGADLGVGDLSLEGGGAMPGHGSHRRGIDVDIRPLRKDKQKAPVTIHDNQYSREMTKQLVGLLQKDPNVQLILFNDSQIPGVRSSPGHDNHLHVRFKD